MYYKPIPCSCIANVREIAHGLLIRTIRYNHTLSIYTAAILLQRLLLLSLYVQLAFTVQLNLAKQQLAAGLFGRWNHAWQYMVLECYNPMNHDPPSSMRPRIVLDPIARRWCSPLNTTSRNALGDCTSGSTLSGFTVGLRSFSMDDIHTYWWSSVPIKAPSHLYWRCGPTTNTLDLGCRPAHVTGSMGADSSESLRKVYQECKSKSSEI